jgi:glycosyltransferase involved in cell wall biosynthesis
MHISSPMYVTIDGTPIVGMKAGVGRYTHTLLQELSQLGEDQIQVFLPGLYPFSRVEYATLKKDLDQMPRVSLKELRLPFNALRTVWRLTGRPVADHWLNGSQIFHGTHHYLPPLKKATGILTVYDVSFVALPDFHTQSEQKKLAAHFSSSFSRARRVIAISEFTKKEFLRFYDYPADRVDVIPLAPASHFKVMKDESFLESVRKRLNLPETFILSVATIQPRKNVLGLLRAFHHAVPSLPTECKLVLVGQLGWMYEPIFSLIRELNLEDRVQFTGFLSDTDLVAVYNLATCFTYVPFYEGFGLPVLEAMACGLPVISSDNTSLPEVAGDAAVIVKAEDDQAIHRAIVQLVQNPADREVFRQKGLKRAAQFNWKRVAQETRNVYRMALEAGCSNDS